MEDGLISVAKNKKTNDPIGLSFHEVEDGDDFSKTIQVGQHNQYNELNGVGRKIFISAFGIGFIYEGQFKNDLLNGFGRRIEIPGSINSEEGDPFQF